MKAYSREMRREVLAAGDRGQGTREVAVLFRVSESWVRRVKQERREQGKLAPCTRRRRIPQWAPYADSIQRCLAQQPDLTLQELKDALRTSLSRQTLCKALARLKLTLKKSPAGRRTGSPRRSATPGRVASPAGGPRSAAAGVPR
jgi:transposase